MYKMIVSDLDGTLLNKQKTISEENIYYINKAIEKGVIFAIATGRIFRSAIHYSKVLNSRIEIASCNGAYTVDRFGNLLISERLSQEAIIKIDSIAKKYDQFFYFYNTNNIYTRYMENSKIDPSKFYPQSKDPIKLTKYQSINSLVENDIPIYKSLFVCPKEDVLDKVHEEFEKIKDITITSSSSNNIEINKNTINKGLAVEKLAKKYKINLEEVIAVGDNRNDISMIERVGLGIAMGNSNEDIKNLANYVSETNEEDAIANIIKEFVL